MSDSPAPPPAPSRAEAAAMLRWLADAGADVLTGDDPGDWLRSPAPSPSREEEGQPDESRVQGRAPAEPLRLDRRGSGGGHAKAGAVTIAARTLEELRAEVETLPFSVRRDGAPLVFADGDPESRIMVIGEAPGAEEERQGKPFVGPAGQLLDKMLAAIELDRTSVYITNLSLWRPGANRVPNNQEAAELLPLLLRHIAVVKPRAILAVGGASAKALLQTPSGIMRTRGRWQDIQAEDCVAPVMPTFHPAYLLREPSQKRLAWRDLLAFRERLAAF